MSANVRQASSRAVNASPAGRMQGCLEVQDWLKRDLRLERALSMFGTFPFKAAITGSQATTGQNGTAPCKILRFLGIQQVFYDGAERTQREFVQSPLFSGAAARGPLELAEPSTPTGALLPDSCVPHETSRVSRREVPPATSFPPEQPLRQGPWASLQKAVSGSAKPLLTPMQNPSRHRAAKVGPLAGTCDRLEAPSAIRIPISRRR